MNSLQIRMTAFTNLMLDHLDYHPTIARYDAAEGRQLFQEAHLYDR